MASKLGNRELYFYAVFGNVDPFRSDFRVFGKLRQLYKGNSICLEGLAASGENCGLTT